MLKFQQILDKRDFLLRVLNTLTTIYVSNTANYILINYWLLSYLTFIISYYRRTCLISIHAKLFYGLCSSLYVVILLDYDEDYQNIMFDPDEEYNIPSGNTPAEEYYIPSKNTSAGEYWIPSIQYPYNQIPQGNNQDLIVIFSNS